MTEQGGALAGLRRALWHRLHWTGTVADRDRAEAALDTALSAVEARLVDAEAIRGRLARFARARDAVDAMLHDDTITEAECDARVAALKAARAALTAEDVAP